MENSPSTKVSISGMINRRDKSLSGSNAKISQINSALKSVCLQKRRKFIDNSNIDQSCLNRRGLHLNRKGSGLLSRNYLKYFNH